MRRIAIIPARGGSKRIPRKNIKDFCGKPILAYSIEAALSGGVFDVVMVSTDDEEIAEIAKAYGAQVPFLRSAEASGDFATTADVLLEVLAEYEKMGQTFDMGCCIFPTAPFVTSKKLTDASEKFSDSTADALFPVVAFDYPTQRAMVIREGNLVFENPKYMNSRSQDLEPHYHDAGQFFFFRVDSFKKNRTALVGEILPLEVSGLEVQDIDNETDWQIAEMKYKLMMEKKD